MAGYDMPCIYLLTNQYQLPFICLLSGELSRE